MNAPLLYPLILLMTYEMGHKRITFSNVKGFSFINKNIILSDSLSLFFLFSQIYVYIKTTCLTTIMILYMANSLRCCNTK